MAGTSFVGCPITATAVVVSNYFKSGGDAKSAKGLIVKAVAGFVAGGFVGGAKAITVGVYSFFRAGSALWYGVSETPAALKSWIVERRRWDPYERRWKSSHESLEDERRDLLREEQELEEARRRRKVASTELYDLLEVPPDASKGTIKKAYFSRARDIHPDKNRDDPRAHERFVELHDAYSVLSDETKRSEYDRWGTKNTGSGGSVNDGSYDMAAFDASVFIDVLLSGDESMSSPIVEKFVGELGLATFVDWMFKSFSFIQKLQNSQQGNGDGNTMNLNGEVLQYIQEYFADDANMTEIRRKRRSVEIASHLVNKTASLFGRQKDQTDDGSDNGTCEDSENFLFDEQRFREETRAEAQQILADSGFYGQTYLQIIGSSLLSETSTWKKILVPFGARNTYRKWYSRKEFARAGYDLYLRMVDLSKGNEVGDSIGKNNNMEYVTKLLPDLMRLIDVYNRMDISGALREAMWRVLNDPGASRVERRNRNRAIRIIGEEYTRLAAESAEGDAARKTTGEDIKSKFLLAFTIAMK